MSTAVKGTLYTVVAGIAWGLSGTSGQYLMAHGISALVLTNLRLLIAGFALVLLSYATSKDKLFAFLKDKKSLLSLLVFALFGLFLNQFAYLSDIQETNAGTATVLQYVCPVGILVYTCTKDKVAPTLAELVSIVLAIGGDLFDSHSWAIRPVVSNTSRPFLGPFFSGDLCPLYHFAHCFDYKMGQYSSNRCRNDYFRFASYSI